MNSSIRAKALPFAIAALLAVGAAPAIAQNMTSSAVTGQVFDASGQPVANATVQIVHEPSGTTKVVTTDAEGRYSAQGLRVGGPFDITATKSGMAQAEQDDVYLQLGQSSSVNLKMAAVEAQNLTGVTVTASALMQTFSPDNRGIGTNVSSREIAATPTPDRSIQNIVRLDPRIVVTDRDRGAFSAIGQNNRFNSITVDSINAGDPFGLNDNGLPTLGTPISQDAIEEYNISTANYDVGNRRGVGADVNAVVKSGTNDFHGSVYYTFQNADDMIGKGVSDTEWSGYSRKWTAGATLGGPIVKDKLFFFANYEKSVQVAPGGNWGPEGSGKANIVQGLSMDDYNRIIDIARNYGLEPGGYDETSNANLEDQRYLAKIDWNITNNHRASLTYSRTKETQPIIKNSYSDELALSSNYYLNDTDQKSVAVHFYDDWTDSFSTEAYYSQSKFHKNRGPLAGGYQPDISVSTFYGGATVDFGTEYSSQANILDVKTRNAELAGTWYVGDHTLKFGVDYQQDEYYNLFLQDLYGAYSFDTIDDFANGDYYSYYLKQPAQGYTLDDVAARFTIKQYGYFLQDTWQANDQLSLQYGFRVDVPKTGDAPPFNPCFSAPVGAAGVGNYGVCENVANTIPGGAQGGFGMPNNNTIDGNAVVQPRLSFNYQFNSERMMQLRGGAGLFVANAPGVWIGNPYQGSGVTVANYQIFNSGATVPFSPDANAQNTPPNSSLPGAGGSSMSVDTMDPNFRMPTVWKLSVGFDRELPWLNTVFTAEYEYLKTRDAIYYTNINLGAPSGVLPDGRFSYYENPNVSPSSRPRSRYYANPSYGNVTRLGNTSRGWADALTVSLKKPFSDSWSGTIAFTKSRSKDVNSATSSVAYSNYQYRAFANPNSEELSDSNYSIPNRLIASLTWQHAFFGDYKTRISAFYDGHSGAPYSWIFGNDVNGDSISRDLVYVPADLNDVQWASGVTDAMKQQFMDYINQDDYLKDHKGQIAKRNGGRAPWVSQLDLSFSQEIPGLFKGSKGEFRLDVYNFTNLLNSDWGVEKRADFPLVRKLADGAGVDPATGQYIYDISGSSYMDDNGNYAPASLAPNEYNNPSQRWSILATVRYAF